MTDSRRADSDALLVALDAATLLGALDAVVDDSILVVDTAGLVLFANAACRRWADIGARAVGTPTALATLVSAESERPLAAALATAALGVSVQRLSVGLVGHEGFTAPGCISVAPLRGESDELLLLVVARDLSEQSFAQSALAELDARARDLESFTHVGTWVLDRRSMTFQWSDECHRLHGVAPSAFSGALAEVLGIVAPQDRARIADAFSVTGPDRALDERFRTTDAHGARMLHLRGEPVMVGGEAIGVRGTVFVEHP